MTILKHQEEFNFRLYFKTSEGTEFLNIFKITENWKTSQKHRLCSTH
jgi:hypothetical protein